MSVEITINRLHTVSEHDNDMNNSVDELLPPEAVLIKRLEHEIIDQQELHNAKLQVSHRQT